FRRRLAADGHAHEIFPISALTRTGLEPLLYACANLIESLPAAPAADEVAELPERKVYQAKEQPDQSFVIRRENELFIIESPYIEKLVKRINFNSREAAMRFARMMRRMGVEEELRRKGAKDGDY